MLKISNILKVISSIRDVLVIIGIPVIAFVGFNIQSVQIDRLKQENELLKLTQYDKAYSMYEGQRKIYEMEIEKLKKDSSISIEEKNRELESLTRKLNETIHQLEKIPTGITWCTPIGPISLNYSEDVREPTPTNDKDSFQFQMGTVF